MLKDEEFSHICTSALDVLRWTQLPHTCGIMPYHDEEYPGQPLWQSVVLFCCKGMIEGIMVLLFFWLLVQVLFTKQLEGMVCNSVFMFQTGGMLRSTGTVVGIRQINVSCYS